MATDHLAIWKCHECSMTFTSPGLLSKHKGKFCPGSTVGRTSRIPRYSPRAESPEGDIPRRNPDPQLAQLAASHGRQMEMLQGKNKDLERQRDEIRRRLEELGRRPIREEDTSGHLLGDLKDAEARNQRLLDELRRQLADARQPINIIAEERYEEKVAKPNLTYPIYYGSSLVAEISAIRQAYLQNGGDDPATLGQLAQMLAEAQAIEDQLRNPPKQTKVVKEKKNTDYMQSLMSLEMENERMQRELMLLQEQNMLARQRRKDDREGRMRYLWGTLRNFVHQDLYQSDRMIGRVRAMTARAMTNRGCCNSCSCSCSGSCSGSCCNSCCCSGRAYTSLGLYSLGATFPYGSIYGYSRLSPLYRDYDDDYIPRIPFRRPFRPIIFQKEEKEVVEETEPERPRIMPFSVYPRIEQPKPKKKSRIVESVVSGFRPGERVMKVYTKQEGEGSGFGGFPTPRYSFNGGGRVNTLYTYRSGGGGGTTRSYSVGGIPHMWSANADPVSGYLSYFSPRDGFQKTMPYASQFGSSIPALGRSSYSAGTLALASPRNLSNTLSLTRPLSNYPTSRSLTGTLDLYPLSKAPPLSYRSTPTTLLYTGEQVPIENGPLVYRGEYVPLEKGPFVYRGEAIPGYTTQNTASGVRIVPVDRDQTSEKENKPDDKSKKGKAKKEKEDKKSKGKNDPKKEETSKDPFVNDPQLAARFHAAGLALQAITRFSTPGTGVPPTTTYPIIPQTARTKGQGQSDPLATDPGLSSRLQAATASLIKLREQNARQQAEFAQKEQEMDSKEARKEEKLEAEEKMKRDMAEARLKSTQRAVHFMTELNRKEEEYHEERAKTRASRATEEAKLREEAEKDKGFHPSRRVYKPPPEEKGNKSSLKKSDTKKKKDKKDKKK